MPTSSALTAVYAEETFQREIHRLLWIDPLTTHGLADPGWSCRDHAFVLSCLLARDGHHCEITHGKVVYTVRPSEDTAPIGEGQDGTVHGMHAWLTLPDLGLLDISPRLARFSYAGRPLHFSGVVGDLQPRGTDRCLVVARAAAGFEEEIAAATHRIGLTAVYWPTAHSRIEADMLANPYAYINSPLSNRLKGRYHSEVYLKAVWHLEEFLNGRRRSLAGVSQSKAWAIIDGISSAEAGALREDIVRRLAA